MTRLAYVMSTSFVVLAIAGRSSVSITPKLIWNASASVPIGLYTVRTAADLGVTDLVTVDAPEPLASFLGEREYLPRGVPLMKRIAALPGQTVCRNGSSVSVDTIAMGEARWRADRRGRELPVWQGCRTLGASEIFLMNWDVRDSLDGRYFGPIPKNSIIGRALPLWTDEGDDGRYLWRAPTH
jgi:conjugative transfer signal peptidase TraF